MNRAVRISAEAVSPNVGYTRLYFDTVIGEDNRIADDETIFGLQGSKDHEGSCEPFVLRNNGRLDWGDADRATVAHSVMDVRSKPLQNGTCLELIYNHRTEEYRITNVEDRAGS